MFSTPHYFLFRMIWEWSHPVVWQSFYVVCKKTNEIRNIIIRYRILASVEERSCWIPTIKYFKLIITSPHYPRCHCVSSRPFVYHYHLTQQGPRWPCLHVTATVLIASICQFFFCICNAALTKNSSSIPRCRFVVLISRWDLWNGTQHGWNWDGNSRSISSPRTIILSIVSLILLVDKRDRTE